MIRLKYTKEESFTITMTEVPISNPQASPSPAGVRVEELDPHDPKYKLKKDAILKHANYSPSKPVTLEPGINEFKNDEQAEYLYKMLGNPEEGGTVPVGVNSHYVVQNENVVFEVDEKGEEIKGVGSLWEKYRRTRVLQTHG